jgi:hypothetical protein
LALCTIQNLTQITEDTSYLTCNNYLNGGYEMWFSDKLYELLPFLYGLVGIIAIVKFDTAIGYGSGALLLFTACLVWFMRRDNRLSLIRNDYLHRKATSKY